RCASSGLTSGRDALPRAARAGFLETGIDPIWGDSGGGGRAPLKRTAPGQGARLAILESESAIPRVAAPFRNRGSCLKACSDRLSASSLTRWACALRRAASAAREAHAGVWFAPRAAPQAARGWRPAGGP